MTINPTPDTPLTGERLRSLRMICGLTLDVLGDRLGYHPVHLGRIERGESPMPADLRGRLKVILVAHMQDVASTIHDCL